MIKSRLKSVILDRLIPDARYVGNPLPPQTIMSLTSLSVLAETPCSLLPAHCYRNTCTWFVGINNDTAIAENRMEVP